MLRIFTDHPQAVGETYWQHLRHASGFAGSLLTAGCVVLVHAILPFLFVTTGSRMICELYGKMSPRRSKALSGDCGEDIGYWVI